MDTYHGRSLENVRAKVLFLRCIVAFYGDKPPLPSLAVSSLLARLLLDHSQHCKWDL